MNKKYKTIIIDGKGVVAKALTIVIITVILLLIYFVLILSEEDMSIGAEKFAINTICEYFPSVTVENATNENIFLKTAEFLLDFNYTDLSSIYENEFPLARVVSRNSAAVLASADKAYEEVPVSKTENAEKNIEVDEIPENMKPIKRIDSSQATALSGSDSEILLKNETSYSINIDEMLKGSIDFNANADPLILILHTHATEAFSSEGKLYYDPNENNRNTDTNSNIVSVGDTVAKVLEENGIKTIHDKTLHDYPSYNGSYANSLATAEKYKEQYPSIQIILDIHRDAIVYDDATKIKVAKDIDGKTAAQIMFVVGTNDGGLDHPKWRENLKFAIQAQKYIESHNKGLMRGINLRKERFNGHTTSASVIVEIGTSGNTLSEAKYGGELFAKSLAEFLKKN